MMKYACVFPGQGSQSLGMLSDLAMHNPLILKLFEKVSNRLGYDVWDLVQNGPLEKLNQTEYTQVAMLVADVAVYQLLSPKPSILAGHSLGEYAALVCAESLSLEDAAELVQYRGQCMQSTIPNGVGAMAAIVGLTDEQVCDICNQATHENNIVNPANYNAIGQVVIAGHTEAVNRAIVLANDLNARLATVIPVSVPCHCNLLEPASKIFNTKLNTIDFKVPIYPVISNVDLSIYESSEQIRLKLSEQLYKPVRWVETIIAMKNQGISAVIECGPGKVLSGLIKRIDRSMQTFSVNDSSSLHAAILEIKG